MSPGTSATWVGSVTAKVASYTERTKKPTYLYPRCQELDLKAESWSFRFIIPDLDLLVMRIRFDSIQIRKKKRPYDAFLYLLRFYVDHRVPLPNHVFLSNIYYSNVSRSTNSRPFNTTITHQGRKNSLSAMTTQSSTTSGVVRISKCLNDRRGESYLV